MKKSYLWVALLASIPLQAHAEVECRLKSSLSVTAEGSPGALPETHLGFSCTVATPAGKVVEGYLDTTQVQAQNRGIPNVSVLIPGGKSITVPTTELACLTGGMASREMCQKVIQEACASTGKDAGCDPSLIEFTVKFDSLPPLKTSPECGSADQCPPEQTDPTPIVPPSPPGSPAPSPICVWQEWREALDISECSTTTKQVCAGRVRCVKADGTVLFENIACDYELGCGSKAVSALDASACYQNRLGKPGAVVPPVMPPVVPVPGTRITLPESPPRAGVDELICKTGYGRFDGGKCFCGDSDSIASDKVAGRFCRQPHAAPGKCEWSSSIEEGFEPCSGGTGTGGTGTGGTGTGGTGTGGTGTGGTGTGGTGTGGTGTGGTGTGGTGTGGTGTGGTGTGEKVTVSPELIPTETLFGVKVPTAISREFKLEVGNQRKAWAWDDLLKAAPKGTGIKRDDRRKDLKTSSEMVANYLRRVIDGAHPHSRDRSDSGRSAVMEGLQIASKESQVKFCQAVQNRCIETCTYFMSVKNHGQTTSGERVAQTNQCLETGCQKPYTESRCGSVLPYNEMQSF